MTHTALRDRLAAALQAAAHTCGSDCPAEDEAACHTAHPIQEAVSHHGVVTDVYAPISALVDVLLPVVAAERASVLRAAEADLRGDAALREIEEQPDLAEYGRELADLLHARADATNQEQQ